MKHPLMKLAEIPENGSVIVPFFGREVHVYNRGGRPRAAANVCPHFGGPLECKEGRLVCPWHSSVFDMETGERLEGPAGKSARLLFLSTRVEGDTLYYVWGE
ncbi:MAG TPA: Rieske (2Fe-2S) protein [Devosia sp.]|nr:Rieske (2Fe-2S) protein [Devosia sp.]